MPEPQPDFAAQRCTCEDWTRRRARFMPDDPRRCCAHLVQGYLESPGRLPPGLVRHAHRLAWFAGEAEGFPVTRQILALTLPGGQPCEAYVPWNEADPWIAVMADGVRAAFHRTQRQWREGHMPPEPLRAEVEAALGRALALHKEVPRERNARVPAGLDDPMPPVPSIPSVSSALAAPPPAPVGTVEAGETAGAVEKDEMAREAEDGTGHSPAVTPSRFHLGPAQAGGTQGLSPWKVAVVVLALVAMLGAGYAVISRGPPLELAMSPSQQQPVTPVAPVTPAAVPAAGNLPVPTAIPPAPARPASSSGPEQSAAAVQTRHLPALPGSGVSDDARQARAMRAFMAEQPGARLYVLSWDVSGGRVELVANLAREVLVRATIRPDGKTVAAVYDGYVLERLALAELGKTLAATSAGEHPPRMEEFFTD